MPTPLELIMPQENLLRKNPFVPDETHVIGVRFTQDYVWDIKFGTIEGSQIVSEDEDDEIECLVVQNILDNDDELKEKSGFDSMSIQDELVVKQTIGVCRMDMD